MEKMISSKQHIRKPSKDGKIKYKQTPVGIIVDVILIAVLLVVIFASIVPMWHTLMASLSDGWELYGSEGGVLWLPLGKATLDGYKFIFDSFPIGRAYLNTIIYVVGSTALGTILNIFGGYVLSRKSKLKPIFMIFILIPMMFSGGTIPTYIVVRSLGMTGSPLSLIIPGCTNAMFLILAMNSFLQVPEATIEAAQIDGAKHMRIMFQVALPQGMSLILVTMINMAIMSWNAWYGALIYLPGAKDWWPLQMWVKEISEQNNTDTFLKGYQSLILRGIPISELPWFETLIEYVVIIISVLPLFIAFPFFIKRLEKNMTLGAVKG